MSIISPATVSYIKEKWQHAGFQRYFRNMGWAFAGKALSLILSFFIGALVARYLGPERYGALNYALSFVTIFVFISSFGIDNIIVRDLVRHKGNSGSILDTSFVLKIAGGVLVIVISTLSSFIFNDYYTTLLIFIYSLHILFASLSVIDSYFQSTVRYKYTFIAQFLSVVIVSLVKLFLIYKGFGTGWFILAIVLDTILSSLILLIIFREQGGRLGLKLDKAVAKKMLEDSWPFILTGAFFLIYTKIDQVMIGQMLDTASLGVYAAGVKLAEIWYFIPAIICSVLFPTIVTAKITENELYLKRLKKLFILIFSVSLFIAFFEFVFAEYLVTFIFGETFIVAADVLKVYTWAGIMVSIITVLHQYLTVENKTKIILISSLLGAVVNVILNLILIPRFNIIGAAWATIISYAIIPIWIMFSIKSEK